MKHKNNVRKGRTRNVKKQKNPYRSDSGHDFPKLYDEKYEKMFSYIEKQLLPVQ